MSEFEPTAVQSATCIEPEQPVPTQDDGDDYCEGVIKIERCCCKKRTRTFVFTIGPQTEPQLVALLQATTAAWEAANYCVEAHSIVDAGAGWIFALTVSWV